MKTEVIKKDQEIKYPCLMKHISDCLYVLFTTEKEGIVIYDEEKLFEVGDYRSDFIPKNFKPTDDIIKISN